MIPTKKTHRAVFVRFAVGVAILTFALTTPIPAHSQDFLISGFGGAKPEAAEPSENAESAATTEKDPFPQFQDHPILHQKLTEHYSEYSRNIDAAQEKIRLETKSVAKVSQEITRDGEISEEEKALLDARMDELGRVATALRQFQRFNRLGKEVAELETTILVTELEVLDLDSVLDISQARRSLLQTAGRLRSALGEIENFRVQQIEILAELEMEEAQADLPEWQQQALQTRREIRESSVHLLDEIQLRAASTLLMNDRFMVRMDEDIATIPVEESISERWDAVMGAIAGTWNFEVMKTGDRPITLGNLVVAVLGLIFALIVAHAIARKVSKTMAGRFQLALPRAHLVEKLVNYALGVIFVLMILQWLSIPLTVFAFLGGALMVGIGFGSQNIMNNFISGLLLLAERKINVGDLVEVDGHLGRVTSLGSRCSSLQLFDGVELLVPNSTLLENQVTNWTLSNPQHRFDFTVGVAYGSDVKLVLRLLKQVLEEQPFVLKDPEPGVFFTDFADSTLDFQLFYWITIGSCDGRQLFTDMRCRIVELFEEHGIEIAFPQRDVHLRAPEPISFRMDPSSGT